MTSYVLPNRVGYIDYIQNKFHPNKIKEIKSKSFEHQILIDKYLNINSPYRGLLLYHELGTGKTATSITLVNQYLKTNKKIYVILPASLRNNYIKELLLHSDFKKYKYTKQWSFNSKGNAQLEETGKLYKECDETEKAEIDKSIKEIILNRINFIHYNGLTATKVNALKGKINIKKFNEYLYKLNWKRVYGLGLKEIKEKFGIDAKGNFYRDAEKQKYVLLPNLVKGLDVKDIQESDKVNIEKIISAINTEPLLFIDTLKLKDYSYLVRRLENQRITKNNRR